MRSFKVICSKFGHAYESLESFEKYRFLGPTPRPTEQVSPEVPKGKVFGSHGGRVHNMTISHSFELNSTWPIELPSVACFGCLLQPIMLSFLKKPLSLIINTKRFSI